MSFASIARSPSGVLARPRRALGVARRVGLPLLALAVATLLGITAPRWFVILGRGPAPLYALAVAIIAVIFALPGLLFGASGLRLGRRGRLVVACLAAVYGARISGPVAQVLFTTRDVVVHGAIPIDDLPVEIGIGWRIIRANPDPVRAARDALRQGDTRLFISEPLGIDPMGVDVSADVAQRYGLREMPGFSDVGSNDPAMVAYWRAAGCYGTRYNAELARHLPGVAVSRGRHDACGPPLRLGAP